MKLTRRGLLGSVALGLLSFLAPQASAFWQSRDSNYNVAGGGAPPPAASLTLISSTTANATSLTVPAHQKGDVIVIAADRLSTTAPTLPNGYTNIVNKSSTATNPVSMRVGYKIAKGTDNTADPSGTWTNAAQVYCEIWRASTGYTVGVGLLGSATSTTNTVNYPALSLADPTGVSQVIGLIAVANTTETIATAPSGMTNRTSLAGTGITIAGHDTNGGVASWASTNVVTTGTAGKSVSCTIELMLLATGTTVAQLYQHANGGANPPSQGFTGNPYNCPLINTSGSGNAVLLWLTYPHASTLTSITDGTNTWSTTPVVSADGGVGNMLTAGFLLTNCAAGQFTVVVTFSGSVVGFAYSCSEFFNIAASGAVNGTASAAFQVGPTIRAGSFTPTSNASGNLVVVHAAKAEGAGTFAAANAVIHAPPFIPLGTNNAWGGTAGENFPYSTAAYLLPSGSINPTVSTPGDAADHYNICAVALKIDTGQGTAPPAGIRIGKINFGFLSLSPAAATFTIQASTTGNLRCLVFTEQTINTGTCIVQDSEGNTYTLDGASAGFYYLPNAIANPNLTLFVTAFGGAGALSVAFYDILSANASPFDSAVALAQSLNSVSSFTASPSPSPTSSSGITIAAIGIEGPGLAVTSPAGAVFDAPTYTGETDFDAMVNAEIYAHRPYSASGAQTWTFNITNRAANGASAGGFISFKA